MTELLNEFDSVVGSLAKEGVRYALVGGLAVAVYGGVRATRDIDFLVHPDDAEKADKAMPELGYKRTVPDLSFKTTGMTIHRHWKMERGDDDVTVVDFLVANDKWMQDLIGRAEREDWRGLTVRVARKEDIVALKMLRGSHKDLSDIETLKEGDQND